MKMNLETMTDNLAKAYGQLDKDEIDATKADALANLAGKLIKANLGQLTYYDQRKSTPVIPFWEQPTVASS